MAVAPQLRCKCGSVTYYHLDPLPSNASPFYCAGCFHPVGTMEEIRSMVDAYHQETGLETTAFFIPGSVVFAARSGLPIPPQLIH